MPKLIAIRDLFSSSRVIDDNSNIFGHLIDLFVLAICYTQGIAVFIIASLRVYNISLTSVTC